MSIKFECKNCGRKKRLDDSFRGKKVRCKCGQTTRLSKNPSTIERADEIFDSDMLEGVPIPAPEDEEVAFAAIDLEQIPIYDEQPDLDPLQPPSGYVAPATSRPIKVESVGMYSKRSIIRLLVAMTSGTLALLFAFLAFSTIADFLLPLFERQREMREEFGSEMAQGLPNFLGVKIFGVLGTIIAIAYGMAGLAQFGISWMQFIKQNTLHGWIDVLVSAISVICIVALLAFFAYANYQIFEVKKAQTDAVKIQQEHFRGNASVLESQDNMKAINETFGKVRWLIFREVFVHCLFPVAVITLSLFRVFRT